MARSATGKPTALTARRKKLTSSRRTDRPATQTFDGLGHPGLPKAPKLNKHQVRSRATQTALLDAAEKVFFRDGFELAQIDVIAAEAGRTRGAVYAHYASKAELFLSVLRRRIEKTDEYGRGFLEKEAARGATAHQAFQNYYVALYQPEWAVLVVEFKLYALRRPKELKKLRQMYRELIGPSTEERRTLMGEHPNGLDVETRFSAMMSFVSAVVLDMLFDPGITDLKQARLLLRGVFDSLVPEKGNG
ncbi:MAG TPA: TetR/AcrR family transcriptional regulator [Acidobacteriaceae bacterium]